MTTSDEQNSDPVMINDGDLHSLVIDHRQNVYIDDIKQTDITQIVFCAKANSPTIAHVTRLMFLKSVGVDQINGIVETTQAQEISPS